MINKTELKFNGNIKLLKMKCCNEKPIIVLSANEKLCKKHFINYFENKVFKTIRQFDLIGKKENLGVAISGGKDSLTLLHIFNKLSKQNPKIKLTAILIDEGIKGYRDKTIKTAKKFCSKNKIKLKIYSFKNEFGMPTGWKNWLANLPKSKQNIVFIFGNPLALKDKNDFSNIQSSCFR